MEPNNPGATMGDQRTGWQVIYMTCKAASTYVENCRKPSGNTPGHQSQKHHHQSRRILAYGIGLKI